MAVAVVVVVVGGGGGWWWFGEVDGGGAMEERGGEVEGFELRKRELKMKQRHLVFWIRDCEEEEDYSILGIGDLCSGVTRLFLLWKSSGLGS